MQAIRKAAERAATQFNTNYPFAVKRFDTDGKHIFAILSQETDEVGFIEELGKGQLAFDRVVKPLFHKIDYRGGADALRAEVKRLRLHYKKQPLGQLTLSAGIAAFPAGR